MHYTSQSSRFLLHCEGVRSVVMTHGAWLQNHNNWRMSTKTEARFRETQSEVKKWIWQTQRKTTGFRALSRCSFRESILPRFASLVQNFSIHVSITCFPLTLLLSRAIGRQVLKVLGLHPSECWLADSTAVPLVANFSKSLDCCQWDSGSRNFTRRSSYIKWVKLNFMHLPF